MTIKVGYWKIRALVAPIQYLLEISGLPHEVKLYEFNMDPSAVEDPTKMGASWFSEKEALNLELPNLPYLIDGDVTLTQSTAIMRYIARKAGLMGIADNASAEEWGKVDMLDSALTELRWNYIYYGANFKTFVDFKFPEGFAAGCYRHLQPFSKFLGSKKFLLGDNVSFLDMSLFETLDVLKLINPDVLSTMPNLEEYYERVRNLPKLKEFLDSDRSTKWPVLGPIATVWGFHKE